MPLLKVLPYLFLGAAVAGGGALIYTSLPPAPQETARDMAARPEQAARPESVPGRLSPDTTAALPPAAEAPTPPSFDVVRIEKNGDGVIAGRAEPGWTVTLESAGDPIARATADRHGEWAVVLDHPLAPGEHAFGLRAVSPGGTRGLVSDQTVAISVAGDAGKDETVAALSQPGQPTRVLSETDDAVPVAPDRREDRKPDGKRVVTAKETPRPADKQIPAPVEASGDIAFSAVDYERDDDDGGKLFLSGKAAAGARVTLYLDNETLGETVAGPDGRWTFATPRRLDEKKSHTLRADLSRDDGTVVARAEVPFARPADDALAEGRARKERHTVAVAREVETAAAPRKKPTKRKTPRRSRNVVIRRGDTLWHIAKRRLGQGARYTAIYRKNRRQIRNPDLIYPGQVFRIPVR